MYMIFDLETTGLPPMPFPNYKDFRKYDSSRIVQMSYMICNKSFKEVKLVDHIIKYDGSITNSHIHGITDEINKKNGVDFVKTIIDEFAIDLKEVNVIIAHNISFDSNVFRSELVRYDLKDVLKEFNEKKHFCTMRTMTDYVNERMTFSFWKFPKMSELYECLYNHDMKNAHNSKYDVINLHKIVQHSAVKEKIHNFIK